MMHCSCIQFEELSFDVPCLLVMTANCLVAIDCVSSAHSAIEADYPKVAENEAYRPVYARISSKAQYNLLLS